MKAATVKDLIFARLLTQLKVIRHEPITACQCSMQTPGTSVHESWTVTKKKCLGQLDIYPALFACHVVQ